MAKVFDQEFIEVSVPVLRKITGGIPFDLFIKRAANTYTKLFPKGEAVEASRLDVYEKDKGVELLYVQNESYRTYLHYVENLVNRQMRDPSAIPGPQFIHIISEMNNLTMMEILDSADIEPEGVAHAGKTVQGCIDMMAQDPASLIQLIQLISEHPYNLKHSLATAIFSLIIAKQVRLDSEKSQRLLGVGAIVHDIGMSRLSFNPEEKASLTAEEWKELKEHPSIGKRLLDPLKGIPSEVVTIVLQHHEQPNGLGYPAGLRDREIYILAKITAIADSFTALVSKRPYRPEPFTPLKAIQMMEDERGKFDPAILLAFRKAFFRPKF